MSASATWPFSPRWIVTQLGAHRALGAAGTTAPIETPAPETTETAPGSSSASVSRAPLLHELTVWAPGTKLTVWSCPVGTQPGTPETWTEAPNTAGLAVKETA